MTNIHQIAGVPWGVVADVAPPIFTEYYLPDDIVAYGSQESRANTYPQEIEYAAARSSIETACARVMAEFLYGDGFEDERLANAIVNSKGQTANELLWQEANKLSKFGGISLFFNLALSGEYASVESYPFTFVRLGIPDEMHGFTHVRVWDNWAGESPRINPNTAEIETIKLFNPERIRQDIIEAGGVSECNGQMMYCSMNGVEYPIAPGDCASEQILATGNIPEFANKYIQNGFSASAVIVDEDGFPNDPEWQQQEERQIRTLSGLRNAGKIGLLYGNKKLMPLSQTNNLDKEYVEIHERLKQDIVEARSIPPVLLGRTRQGGFPNSDEMRDAYKLYNKKTTPYRHFLSRQFKKFGDHFIYDLGDNYNIKVANFDYNNNQKERTLDSSNPDQAKAQAQLRGSVGGVQGLLQVAESFRRGTISELSAITVLEEIYGFTNDVAKDILSKDG